MFLLSVTLRPVHDECGKRSHDRYMENTWVLSREAGQGMDASDADRPDVGVAQHLCPLLESIVPQILFCDFALAVCRSCLSFGDDAPPNGQRKANCG